MTTGPAAAGGPQAPSRTGAALSVVQELHRSACHAVEQLLTSAADGHAPDLLAHLSASATAAHALPSAQSPPHAASPATPAPPLWQQALAEARRGQGGEWGEEEGEEDDAGMAELVDGSEEDGLPTAPEGEQQGAGAPARLVEPSELAARVAAQLSLRILNAAAGALQGWAADVARRAAGESLALPPVSRARTSSHAKRPPGAACARLRAGLPAAQAGEAAAVLHQVAQHLQLTCSQALRAGLFWAPAAVAQQPLPAGGVPLW